MGEPGGVNDPSNPPHFRLARLALLALTILSPLHGLET